MQAEPSQEALKLAVAETYDRVRTLGTARWEELSGREQAHMLNFSRKLIEALSKAPPLPVVERMELAFRAGFKAAERGLGFEGADEGEEALEIEWNEYRAALSSMQSIEEGQ